MGVNFSKFLHSQTGKILMSIILGLGLATFFRSVCKGKECIISYAPPLDEIDDETYKFDNKCYKFEKNAVNCNDKEKQIYDFA
jgi:hypothetical protein